MRRQSNRPHRPKRSIGVAHSLIKQLAVVTALIATSITASAAVAHASGAGATDSASTQYTGRASTQTPTDKPSSGLSVKVKRNVSPSGTYDSWWVYLYDSSGNLRGSAHFKANGEQLYACDEYPDGRTARAGLELDWGGGSGWVIDPNGSANTTCGLNDLNTAENVPATLYACVDTFGCR